MNETLPRTSSDPKDATTTPPLEWTFFPKMCDELAKLFYAREFQMDLWFFLQIQLGKVVDLILYSFNGYACVR